MSALESKTTDERPSVRIRFTKNMGDFNSLSVEVGLDRDLRDGETLSEAFASIRKGLQIELDKTFDEVSGE